MPSLRELQSLLPLGLLMGQLRHTAITAGELSEGQRQQRPSPNELCCCPGGWQPYCSALPALSGLGYRNLNSWLGSETASPPTPVSFLTNVLVLFEQRNEDLGFQLQAERGKDTESLVGNTFLFHEQMQKYC